MLRFAPQTRPDRPVDFTYDGHGNRIVRTVPLPPKPELTAAEQRSLRGTGNLLRVMEVLTGTPKYEAPTEEPEVVRYRYDGSHQLIAIEHADGARSEYEYDALGRRVAKHHTQASGVRRTTLFMWDGDWMMQEVRSGRTSHEDRAVTYVPHPDHEGPLTRLAEGEAWHYVTDHLGTPQELYDEQREVVWAADLSAYGRTARRLAHVVDNPIRFPGQYYDRESGLHYNRFRYYDPMVGRYINQDPIGLAGGANSYTYADARPTVAVDSHGLASIAVGAEMGAAAGTVVFPGVGTIVGGVVGTIAGIGVVVWMASRSDDSNDSVTGTKDRTVSYPDRVRRKYTCICRANRDGRSETNCSRNDQEFAMGYGVGGTLMEAKKMAEKDAKEKLCAKSTHHVQCRCTGPKGERIIPHG